MRIQCPYCGERDSGEFSVIGAAGVLRPDADKADAAASFTDAVYLRDNPVGRHQELWYHGVGCRSWLRVTRDTRTHEIFSVDFARDGARL